MILYCQIIQSKQLNKEEQVYRRCTPCLRMQSIKTEKRLQFQCGKRKKLLDLLNQTHSGTEAMKSWSTLRVTVFSPFVELLQSPFPLHRQDSTAKISLLKKSRLGSLSSSGYRDKFHVICQLPLLTSRKSRAPLVL